MEGTCVAFVVAGRDGEGRTSGFERKMKDVRMDVTVSETERPGFERSSMYQRAGLTRASVRVSWRVDCQGRRRCGRVLVRVDVCSQVVHETYDSERDSYKGCYAPYHIIDLLADG